MTVSAQNPIKRATGNGVTTVFPYDFKIIVDADLEVVVNDVVKTLNVDYTVAGAGLDAGGDVTFTTAPAALTTVVLRRNMSLVRTTDYQNQGQMPAATIDDDHDAAILMIQQVNEKADRSLHLPASVSGVSTELPAPQARHVNVWNVDGTALESLPAQTGTSLVDLAATTGAALVGSDDGSSGSLWTTVQGFINKIISSAGASVVGFIQSGTGAVARFVQDKLRDTVSVKDFGAVGDGVTDDTAAIQLAIDTGKNVYFPIPSSFFKTTSQLIVVTNFQTLYGDSPATVIKNTGIGKAIYVTSQYNRFRGLSLSGNGGAFGVGATGTYGIHFHGARAWELSDVLIRYHGSHGVYCTGGVWQCEISPGCEIIANGGDGVNSISPSGASNDQNGNALGIIGAKISLNNGNGVQWKGASLSIIGGSSIEANKGYGLLTDCTGLTNSAYGINVSGNYFENNVLGEMKFIAIAGVVMSGVTIHGNYLYSAITGPTALISFEGPTRSNQGIFIGGNSAVMGGTVVNLVDGGSSLREDCTINAGPYATANLGYARLIMGVRTKTMLGAFSQAGLTWADPTGLSANFFSAATVTTYFDLDLSEGDLLWDITWYVESNCTAAYSLDAYIFSSDPTTGATPTAVASTSLSSGAGGGNTTFTWAPTVTSLPIRISNKTKMYLRIRYLAPSTGTSEKMGDLSVRYV